MSKDTKITEAQTNDDGNKASHFDKVVSSNINYSGTNLCPKCGKPYSYVGDVPDNGWVEGFEPYCTCNKKQVTGLYGWVCPVCGRGNSPYTSTCPCQGYPKMEIIC